MIRRVLVNAFDYGSEIFPGNRHCIHRGLKPLRFKLPQRLLSTDFAIVASCMFDVPS
jgi:hypothetical protein